MNPVKKSVSKYRFCFSGTPQLSISPQNISLEGFTEQTFTYTLSDENDNPLAAGTSVSVSVDNDDLSLNGNTDVTIGDTHASGDGTTEFSFTLSNPNQVSFTSSSTVTISSEGPNGSISEQIQLLPPDVDPVSPGSITLASVSNSEIGVKETGQQESTDLTFQVNDLSGKPLNLENSVEVSFSLGAAPNGGEQLSPTTAVTNGDGQVITTLTSGTTSGVVQVIAEFTSNGNTITSKAIPVTIVAGMPVQNNFNLQVNDDTQNMVAESGDKMQLTAFVGDKHGNPVSEGTSISFSTDRGIVTGSAQTDANGEAFTTYTASGQAGTATIEASTANSNQQSITDAVQILLSGTPQLSVSSSSVDLTDFENESFTYTLEDENGNPLAAGTNISLSVDNADLSLSGDTDITLDETSQPGTGTTEFSFTLSNPNGVKIYEDGAITITASGPNGSASSEITLNAPNAPSITPGSITLASLTRSEIGVVSTGQTEQTQLIFQVSDSTGQPLNADNKVNVSFRLGSSPTGANVKPKIISTNTDGQAIATLTSGTGAGVAQVIAEITANGTTIKSQPVAVTIHAGLPDQDHFTLTGGAKNVLEGTINKIPFTVIVGDKHGNIVQEGTSIYFTTDGGVIGGSGQTNAEGEATAMLTTSKPHPPGGVATITAETAGDNGQTISDDVKVVFSEADPQITTSTNSINLENLQNETVNYTVLDLNGNPLPKGTTVSVSVDNQDLTLSGDTQVSIPDAFNTGSGVSDFSFTISNPHNLDIYEDAAITIVASAPNVNGSSNSAEAKIALDAPSPPALNPGNITLSDVSNGEIGVVNTGQNEQTKLTFQVTDSLGRALDLENKAEVRFSLGASPGGGEGLTPTSVMTDAKGRATTTLTSGTDAGVAQVVAEVTASDGTVINSQSVSVAIHAGLPDQDHFSLASSTNNVAANTGTEVNMTAYVGDKHGNVVAPGTTVYFTTDGGYISGSSQTNEKGIATAILQVVQPTPADGTATVTASTANDQQATITATKDIIFSGTPTITANPNSINMPNDANTTFNYTVEDGNGHPMAPGTNISVTVEGNEIETIGDVDITLGEPNASFSNISQLTDFQFNIADAAGDTVATDPVQITITSEGPNGTARTTISGTKSKSIN
ncbi:MAG: hypothetical protein U5K69_21525 [Balneolaceae bacterium]|nr:hypothetical protein [Balneolaceae bacterium]